MKLVWQIKLLTAPKDLFYSFILSKLKAFFVLSTITSENIVKSCDALASFDIDMNNHETLSSICVLVKQEAIGVF